MGNAVAFALRQSQYIIPAHPPDRRTDKATGMARMTQAAVPSLIPARPVVSDLERGLPSWIRLLTQRQHLSDRPPTAQVRKGAHLAAFLTASAQTANKTK